MIDLEHLRQQRCARRSTSGQTASSIAAGDVKLQEHDRRRPLGHRQGRSRRGTRPHDSDRDRQCHGERHPHHRFHTIRPAPRSSSMVTPPASSTARLRQLEVPTGSGVSSSGNVVTDGSGNSTVYLETATTADLLTAVDLASGVQTATNSGGTATIAATPANCFVGCRQRHAEGGTGQPGPRHHRHRQLARRARAWLGNTGTGTSSAARGHRDRRPRQDADVLVLQRRRRWSPSATAPTAPSRRSTT